MIAAKLSTKSQILWLIALILGTIFVLNKNNNREPYNTVSGGIFGTIYHITYQYDGNLKPEIEQELKKFDASLSPFNNKSVISRINRNETAQTDSFFRTVFKRSMEISQLTGGAFDITIAPLANAWGFGFKKGDWPTPNTIDSLQQLIGYGKIELRGDTVYKHDPRIMISASAIAKGYAVDVIAKLLDRKGIKNYLVEIGGEIVASGINSRKENWRIAINKPVDDSLAVNQEQYAVLELTGKGLATSGNYRNYYYKDGKKYAHTIDPTTGYPVEHNLLSTTVIASDCMTADALATAFMVMGLKKAEEFTRQYPDIAAYFIYTDEDGTYRSSSTESMKQYIR